MLTIIFTCYFFVSRVNLGNRNAEVYHSGSRVKDYVARGLQLLHRLPRCRLTFVQKYYILVFLTTLCPAISHNSVLPRCKMAWCITIFWYLSAPMIARITCLKASVDRSPQPYRMHSVAGRASTRLL